MTETWLNLLGIDASRIPEGAETEFIWTHAPESWGLFVLIGLAVLAAWGVVFLYRREIESCPRPMRLFLAGLRVLVLLLLLLIFLGPALSVSTRRTVDPVVLVLADTSQSMSIADRYYDDEQARRVASWLDVSVEELRLEQPTRIDLVERVLSRENGRWLAELTERGSVQVMTFDDDLETKLVAPASGSNDDGAAGEPGDAADEAAGADEASESAEDGVDGAVAAADAPPGKSPEAAWRSAIPNLEATGPSTRLAGAVREAVRSLSGRSLAGVIVLSDGQDTTRQTDLEAVASFAASQGASVLTVGVGDPSKPRNLRVADVFAADPVWQGDPFELEATLAASGLSTQSVRVELVAERVDEPGASAQVLETRNVMVGEDSGPVVVRFVHNPEVAGDYRFSVRTPTLEGEFFDGDNAGSTTVKVLSEKARILMIAGAPSYEYRMLHVLWRRDKTIELASWLQTMDVNMPQEGDIALETMPYTFEELAEYDVIVLIDPNPTEFPADFAQSMERFLGEHGGGLLYVAGPTYSTGFFEAFNTRDLADMLPVELDELSVRDIESLVGTQTRGWPLQPVDVNLDHPVMRLENDPVMNQARWQAMPPVFWSFPAGEPKPGARVMLEHPDPSLRTGRSYRPLLASGQYGPGRTVYQGFNSTWRWRAVGRNAEYFNRYWVQAVRFLVEGRLLGGKRRGLITLDRESIRIGDDVTIRAKLFDSRYEPLEAESVTASLTAESAATPRTVELTPIPGSPGEYQGTAAAVALGLNTLSLPLPDVGGVEPVVIERQFTVSAPEVEFADPRMNRSLLRELAEASGGTYLEIDEVDRAPELTPQRRQSVVVAGRPIELWDTNRALIVILVLLTLEWGLRKRFKLL